MFDVDIQPPLGFQEVGSLGKETAVGALSEKGTYITVRYFRSDGA